VWEVAASDAGTMDGDSADPIIAEAYALGVRGFDVRTALAQMVAGATRPLTTGGTQQRPFLAEFNRDGYVQAFATGQDGTFAVGASITLEYAIDDFAVAELAGATGHPAEAARMMARAQAWELLYDPSTGYLEARQADGSFPAGPAFQPTPPALEASGQNKFGFQEGNALQYTWSVPQDLGQLFALMGGDRVATARLRQFLTQLNAGPFEPYDWSGDEPDFWVPWEFDASGAPWLTQQSVRRIATTLYSLRPDGEPGNDDLGTMSAWYVWAALGLYPLTPGTGDLVLASPMFPSATVGSAGGPALRITASGTPGVYVQQATLASGSGSAMPWSRPWLPAGVVRAGGTLHLALGSRPDRRWGTGAAAAPPSFRASALPLLGFTVPSGALSLGSGGAAAVTLGVEATGTAAGAVDWTATASPGIRVSPASGVLRAAGARPGDPSPRVTATVEVTATGPGRGTVRFGLVDRTPRRDGYPNPGAREPIPPVVLDVTS
jgi:predicted alpha-1,2-mannosidase